ncbi:MAG TPA: hypothetical protein VFQ87_18565, partial [Bradyrhizobium sp.]|nr:hypothetical protein [Bradyrhizobium sp.]
MPGLVPGIHVLAASQQEDVDGRDKPGHDNFFIRLSGIRPPGEILFEPVDVIVAVDNVGLAH